MKTIEEITDWSGPPPSQVLEYAEALHKVAYEKEKRIATDEEIASNVAYVFLPPRKLFGLWFKSLW